MATGYLLVDSPNLTQPQGTFPRRGGAKLSGTCIVHTSEGNWQAGVDSLTNLVRARADWGCYHRACDWADIALYYPWEWETWQDTETNNWAAGIAAACKTTDWGTMPADIEEGYYRNLARMAADFVTYMKTQHGITVPLKRITGAEARARVPGFAAHGDSGVARSDPGANFDWTRFFNYTRQALGGITTQSTEELIMSWTTKIQEYQKDGKTKAGIKTAGFILGNLNQWVGRILEGQVQIRKDIAALRKEVTGKEVSIDWARVEEAARVGASGALEGSVVVTGDVTITEKAGQ
jgi:hypothetical protein